MVPEVIAKKCPNQQRFQDSAQPQNNKEEPSSIKDEEKNENTAVRFWSAGNSILLSSYLNFLLIFVPVGIAVHFAGLNPIYVFAFNAIAIVPLAGLLSHATESVARRMGDTVGALVNITFGNAVELIIFIALQKNELRIVQASLLGSILANLLLILGMCFLVGGLRFREQVSDQDCQSYKMSACLLSLAVMSLLLPTAFHASFSSSQSAKATSAVLKVSRGTSVVLLLVYGMYLLFQLKSHSYLYQSTPQHLIDEESAPGPVAAWMESSNDNSSISSLDSDGSGHSNLKSKRVKSIIKYGTRSIHSRKSKDAIDTNISPNASRKSSSITACNYTPGQGDRNHSINLIGSDLIQEKKPQKTRRISIVENKISRKRKSEPSENKNQIPELPSPNPTPEVIIWPAEPKKKSPSKMSARVDYTFGQPQLAPNRVDEPTNTNMPFNLGLMNNFSSFQKNFAPNVFTQPPIEEIDPMTRVPPAPRGPRVRYGIRRTSSLPDRLTLAQFAPTEPPFASTRLVPFSVAAKAPQPSQNDENVSRTTSLILLLISTGLVALCAEFMVDSINAVVAKETALSEAFIGLIILPIVGNAAEHVTAVTVASKNKMDLAIGVAVGSSIQIALFVTPFVVLLGWCMGKELSLYFTLFETVSLFVSAFIVNFLVLDGRSNYLEGALLCAAYVMIAVAAFFYPSVQESSNLGGNDASTTAAKRMVEFVASMALGNGAFLMVK
ncbi:vacuolar H+/Ca2+ exchanger/membrane bound cation transporter [Blumeria hordei DH14]|uniref:Vacuolar H+/Ca2+ exchanger/membrane bound cation transporter n=1 Tax=Blumeria graminis f. sp. hordei (strain DH14) TaxID=546991 RepID=N1JGX6_BLUG1|nr:vacuolar H+/Ca2+ exchanger/membrane bound cation transporter [Blumeria hordei DH14]